MEVWAAPMQKRTRYYTLLPLILALGACDTTGKFQQEAESPFAPPGVAQGEAVDGLTVGHRLMAAGEFELALEAYYRAAA